MQEEYKKRHDNIWPEMKEVLANAGIVNYSIWMQGEELFGYYECEKGVEYAAKVQAESDVVQQREESLAKQLAEMKSRKRRLVDPLQFDLSIQAEDLAGYTPAFGWEIAPPSEKQLGALEKWGIRPDEIECAGKAAKLLDRLAARRTEGLTTPKQIRFLEGKGFEHVGTWQFEQAKQLIDRIAANGWRIPRGIDPKTYMAAIPVTQTHARCGEPSSRQCMLPHHG